MSNHSLIKSKLRYIFLAVFVLAILGVVYVLAFGDPLTTSPADKTRPGSEVSKKEKDLEQKVGADTKSAYLDGQYSQDSMQPSAESSNSTSTATLRVEVSQQGQTVVVLTKIQGVTSGSCNLVAKNNGTTISRDATIIYQPEFSSCAGFSLPVTALGQGNWEITINASTNAGVLKELIGIKVQ